MVADKWADLSGWQGTQVVEHEYYFRMRYTTKQCHGQSHKKLSLTDECQEIFYIGIPNVNHRFNFLNNHNDLQEICTIEEISNSQHHREILLKLPERWKN